MPIPSNAYLRSDGELKITVVVDDVTIRNRQESLIQITMVASCQDPNAEYTAANIRLPTHSEDLHCNFSVDGGGVIPSAGNVSISVYFQITVFY